MKNIQFFYQGTEPDKFEDDYYKEHFENKLVATTKNYYSNKTVNWSTHTP